MGRHSFTAATVQNGEVDPVEVAEYVVSVMFVDKPAFVWQVFDCFEKEKGMRMDRAMSNKKVLS